MAMVLGLMVQVCFASGSDIHGLWKLVSYEVEAKSDGKRSPVMGEHPTGYAMFQPDGKVFFILTGEGRQPAKTDAEKAEVVILQSYLPQALSDAEVSSILDTAIKAVNATSIKEMGQVMAIVKPQVVGRADMGKLSALIKQKLS